MMRNNIDLKSKVALKFIMSKLKRLIINKNGNMDYMENLDELLKDIFGVKNFTKKLDSCYDDRESIAVINEIGLKNLMSICNTPRIYEAVSELVIMNYEIHKTSKIIKKLEKRGKNKEKKSFEKEYEYLVETYRKAIKTLRKTFGTKKASYKKKFRSVSNLIDSRKGFSYYNDDNSVSSVLYDEEDSFYDEDDDDGDEFENYLKKVLKGDKKKENKKNPQLRSRQSIDMDDEDDDDEFDSDEDDEDDDIESRIDVLTGKMDTVTSALHALINSANTNNVKQQPQAPIVNNVSPNGDIGELNKAIMYLAKCQKESVEKQNDIISLLTDMLESGDDDSDDEDAFRAVINEAPIQPQPKRSPTNQSNQSSNLNNLSKEDLISYINQSHNQTANVAYCHDEMIIEPRVKTD